MSVIKEGYVQQVIERYENDGGMLIPMMQDLQAEYGYLPPEELRLLARELRIPLTRVYGAAMFYSSFRMSPRGQHEVTLCMGTVCYLKGAPKISQAICDEYGITPGGTTADRMFTLQAVNCVGACALAPVMVVDGKYYDGVTPDSALKILKGFGSAADEAGASELVTKEGEPTPRYPADSVPQTEAPAPSVQTAPPNPPGTAARYPADSAAPAARPPEAAPVPAAADPAAKSKTKDGGKASTIGKARKTSASKTSARKEPGAAKALAKDTSTPRKSRAKPPATGKPSSRKRSRP